MSNGKTEYTIEITGSQDKSNCNVREWLNTLPCVVICCREDGDFEIIASETPDYKVGTIVPRLNNVNLNNDID